MLQMFSLIMSVVKLDFTSYSVSTVLLGQLLLPCCLLGVCIINEHIVKLFPLFDSSMKKATMFSPVSVSSVCLSVCLLTGFVKINQNQSINQSVK